MFRSSFMRLFLFHLQKYTFFANGGSFHPFVLCNFSYSVRSKTNWKFGKIITISCVVSY